MRVSLTTFNTELARAHVRERGCSREPEPGGIEQTACNTTQVFSGGSWRSLPQAFVAPMLTADKQGAYRADNHAWLFSWSNGTVLQVLCLLHHELRLGWRAPFADIAKVKPQLHMAMCS